MREASRARGWPSAIWLRLRRIHSVKYSKAKPAPITKKASRGNGGAASLLLPPLCESAFVGKGRNKRAVRAGLKVSELNAEISVETAIVSANCLKNNPVMPLI